MKKVLLASSSNDEEADRRFKLSIEQVTRGIKTYVGFEEYYPMGSEGRLYAARVMGFWETVRVIARRGLIDHDLLFDRYLIDEYWERLKPDIDHRRKENPLIAENFEYLAIKAKQWGEARLAKLKKEKKR